MKGVEGIYQNNHATHMAVHQKYIHKKRKQLTSHLWCVGDIVVHQLSPDGRHGRQMKMWIVDVFVDGQ